MTGTSLDYKRYAEQKVRGRKWNNRRPGFIICDDLENISRSGRREVPQLVLQGSNSLSFKDRNDCSCGHYLHLDSVLMGS